MKGFYMLTEEELRELREETWKLLKTDPLAAWRLLHDAGWISDEELDERVAENH